MYSVYKSPNYISKILPKIKRCSVIFSNFFKTGIVKMRNYEFRIRFFQLLSIFKQLRIRSDICVVQGSRPRLLQRLVADSIVARLCTVEICFQGFFPFKTWVLFLQDLYRESMIRYCYATRMESSTFNLFSSSPLYRPRTRLPLLLHRLSHPNK